MFTYSPVSKTSVQVSIRVMPSELHKPGLEEGEGIFQARNFRSASFISSPTRIPRNSKGMGRKTAKGNVGALRPDPRPAASGTTGTCAKANSDTPIINKYIRHFIFSPLDAMLPKTGAFLWDLVRRMGGSTEDGASPAYAENEKASMPSLIS